MAKVTAPEVTAPVVEAAPSDYNQAYASGLKLVEFLLIEGTDGFKSILEDLRSFVPAAATATVTGRKLSVSVAKELDLTIPQQRGEWFESIFPSIPTATVIKTALGLKSSLIVAGNTVAVEETTVVATALFFKSVCDAYPVWLKARAETNTSAQAGRLPGKQMTDLRACGLSDKEIAEAIGRTEAVVTAYFAPKTATA